MRSNEDPSEVDAPDIAGRGVERLVVLLIATGSAVLWVLRPTRFIADDSYFYLVIARNLGLRGDQTFSGITDTNGFHPLWGYTLSLYSGVVGRINEDWVSNPRYALPLAMALLAAAVVVWLKVADRLALSPAIVAGIPVAYVCLFGTLYSEALMVLTVAGLLALRLCGDPDRTPRWWAGTGLLAGLMLLSRIDMMFFATAALVVLAWRFRPSWRDVAVCGLAGGIPVAAYLAFNTLAFGHPIPISGSLKTGFPHLNLRGVEGSGVTTVVAGVNVLFGLLPFAVAALTLVTARGHRALPVLTAMFAGAGVQIGMIAGFGHGPTSWYWYYVITVAMAALSVAILVESTPIARLAPVGALSAAAVAVVFGGFTAGESPPQQDAIRLAQSLDPDVSQTLIVSDFPGRVAFDTDVHVFAADLLTTNYDFHQELLGAPDALEFIRDRAAEAGAPVTAVIHNGNSFMRADDTGVTLFDPADYPDGPAIGRLELGEPTGRNGDHSVWWVIPAPD